MSQKTRGVFEVLIKSIISGLRRKTEPKFIGEDYFGTKYYEEPVESSGRKTRGRFFEPVNDEDFQQEMPAEWESWLRYRRKEPPTKEEIEINYRMIMTKRENAAKLEIEYSGKRDETAMATRDEQHSGSSFPIYEEYDGGLSKKTKQEK